MSSVHIDQHAIYRRMIGRKLAALTVAGIVLFLGIVVDVLTGPALLPVGPIVRALLAPDFASGDPLVIIVWQIRLPMALMAVVVGVALGAAGAEMQTILNNPLASPYTLGLSAAAGFGAAFAILFGSSLVLPSKVAVPLLAFAMSSLACTGIFAVGRMRRMTAETMILAGIALLFLFQSLQSLMQYMAAPEILQQIVFWLFGSLLKATWQTVAIVALVLVVTLPLLMRDAWRLTALKLGDDRAHGLGIDVERLRLRVFIAISLLTAAAVCFVGTIGFVGLIAPHIARLLVGEDQRFFLPLSAIYGALIMCTASIASKTLSPGAVFPIGIVTAIAGVPFFFFLILRSKRRYW